MLSEMLFSRWRRINVIPTSLLPSQLKRVLTQGMNFINLTTQQMCSVEAATSAHILEQQRQKLQPGPQPLNPFICFFLSVFSSSLQMCTRRTRPNNNNLRTERKHLLGPNKEKPAD